MANKKISELAAAGTLTGAELVEAVQGGVNVQTTTQNIANLAPATPGAEAFLDLTDVPNSYSGEANKVVSVKADESGLEFTTPASGTVTSGSGTTVAGTAVNLGGLLTENTTITGGDKELTIGTDASPLSEFDLRVEGDIQDETGSINIINRSESGAYFANAQIYSEVTSNLGYQLSEIQLNAATSGTPGNGVASVVVGAYDEDATTSRGYVRLQAENKDNDAIQLELLSVGTPVANLTGGNLTMGTNKITGLGAATANGDAVRYEQLIERSYLPVARTGTAIAFATNNVYGTPTTPITGNLTANQTGAVLGNVSIVVHNDSVAPTLDSNFKLTFGIYVINEVNIIQCTYLEANYIEYSITSVV